ncbi:hypothetical protein AERO8C_20092 [Aeromonas veronii]|uniref:Uncharacterized protein n=1 Tax=Aeromonas veronii TaxID=654 RepID=A0A653KZT0_AERVE|nr:hypothetical protein AERO8C_20092 [Aeromonas veronii]
MAPSWISSRRASTRASSSTIPTPKASVVAAKASVSELFDVNDPSSVVERVVHGPFNYISFAKGE